MKIKYIVLFSISIIIVSSVMFSSSFVTAQSGFPKLHLIQSDVPKLYPIGNHTTNDMDTMSFMVKATKTPPMLTWFLLEGEPYAAHIDWFTGEFTWSPKPVQVGLTFTFNVTANNENGSDYETISITSWDTHDVLHP